MVLVGLAHPDELQTQWVSTGYTQMVRNKAYLHVTEKLVVLQEDLKQGRCLSERPVRGTAYPAAVYQDWVFPDSQT